MMAAAISAEGLLASRNSCAKSQGVHSTYIYIDIHRYTCYDLLFLADYGEVSIGS